MEFPLRKILTALLLSTSESLSIRDIQDVIARYHEQTEGDPPPAEEEPPASPSGGQAVMRDLIAEVPALLTAAQIREALEALEADWHQRGEPFRLVEGAAGWRLCVRPAYADWVRLLRGEPRPQRLSPAQLETLAIIAYRQPVTRAELEAIRGVSADSAVQKLLERELIHVTGRAELPGRPLQYGTTPAFLDYAGLRSLEELPASDVLSPNEIDLWIRRATNNETPATDQDVGLPLE